MKHYSRQELDSKTLDIVVWIYRSINDLNLVQKTCNTYKNICHSKEAKGVGIKYREITEETRLRLLFEMLCFATSQISNFIAQIIARKKIFTKVKNDEAERYFNLQVGKNLSELCENLGMSSLREIILISITPNFEFGCGDKIDPIIDRLMIYMKMTLNKSGSELEYFGQHIGKSLDPDNYPTLGLIGGELGLELAEVTKRAFEGVFK